MLNQEIDWNEVNKTVSTGFAGNDPANSGSGEKSVFLKVKAGFHHLRLVPSGNPLKKTFSLQVMQHPVKVPSDDGTRTLDKFVLCWSFLLNDLKSYTDPNEQKTKTYISHLGSQKLLNQEQFTLYNTYGCPFCKIFNAFNQMGLPQETKNKFYPNEQWFFNVIFRSKNFNGMPASGDDEVYIWRQAKKSGNSIMTTIRTMREQAGVNFIDVNTGRDIIMQATGEGLGRRYPMLQFVEVGTPLNLGERIPHNLLKIINDSFMEYQKAVNCIKATYGELLKANNYLIPGDQALTQAYGNAVQTVNMVNQHIAQHQTPSQVIQPPQPNFNTQGTDTGRFSTQEPNIANVPQSVPQEQFNPSFQSGDDIISVDGKLFNKRTGQFMF